MPARDDAMKKFALLASAVVVLLLGGVVAWQIDARAGRPTATVDPAASVLAAAAPIAPTATPSATTESGSTPPGSLVFEAGSTRLSSEAIAVLNRVADGARASAGATVEISGYYPAGADAVKSAALATARTQAARHALEANGVAPAQMRSAVAEAPAGTDAREAGRIELVVH